MIKVMIADDDYYVRDGLSHLLNWEELGAQLVFVAANGRQVLEFLEKEQVDLLILDIKMPFVSGIEVAKYVHENMPAIQMILLSAYADFEYAREAVSAGIREYILKPINHKKILQLSNTIRDVATETEFTKRLTTSVHDGTLKNKIEEILRDKDVEMLDKLLTAPVPYKNFDVYRSFCIQILKHLSRLHYPSEEAKIDKEVEWHQHLMNCTGIHEMKDFTMQECMKHIEHGRVKYNKNELLIQSITAYIQESFQTPDLNVQSVAERFDYTPDYLSRLFKQQTGISMQEWIIDVRLKKAAELLQNSDLTIWQIADRSGYDNIQHFVRLFKKRNGVTPTEFRLRGRAQ